VPPAGKSIKENADGYFYIDPASFAADFCADVPPAKAEFMAKSQVLFSKDSFTSPVTTPAWKSKPSWYLVATETLIRHPLLPTSVRMFHRLKLNLWPSRKFYFPRTRSHRQLLLRLGSRNPAGIWWLRRTERSIPKMSARWPSAPMPGQSR